MNLYDSSQLTKTGYGYLQSKQYDKAIIALNKAIEIDNANCDAYNMRGIAYSGKKMYDQAILKLSHSCDF